MSFNPQPKKIRQKKAPKPLKKISTKKKRKSTRTMPKHIRDRALAEFQKLRKLQESKGGVTSCISCGKPIKYGTNDCQGGHYISRQNRATELEPDNIQPQCASCNVLKKGNYTAYRFNLVEKIGIKRVERLENMALAREGSEEALSRLSLEDRVKALERKTQKDYYELYLSYKQQIKELEAIYGINN